MIFIPHNIKMPFKSKGGEREKREERKDSHCNRPGPKQIVILVLIDDS